ncbi:alpha/beta fold hydrolase [Streptomyces sp. NPDC048057]|uniref:alpha/beta fold hydrolase n=1 Tax=Streptomyces sp. NPDC048057 TaxID=3155628 RepID=UPI0033EC6ABF
MTPYRQPGVRLTDHRFTVPLDHAAPNGETLELFGREVVDPARAGDDLPWLVYLEGGPGFGALRSIGREAWLERALKDHRVLLLDHRGTGASTPQNRRTLAHLPTDEARADHLAHFRADSIVRDCELVRARLTGGAPWSVLGQSFGGFSATHYLSAAPEGLREVFITGGLPSLAHHADDVYRAAYPRIERKVAGHYERYPMDVERARRITAHLAEHRTVLPGGYVLTPEAFQSLGIMLGASTGSHRLHHLLENAFVRVGDRHELADAFQESVLAALSFAGHPIYALLHEAIYGQDERPTAWSAERVRAEFPQFDAVAALEGDGPVLFTGETIHPWHFDVDPSLRPLKEAADLLAARTDWAPLYDAERLAANEVPVAAAIYHDDMYVDTAHSLRTARTIRGLRTWVTDEYEHDGLRADGPRVLDRLIGLVRGEV